jgi:CYTH domain-containing protein
MGIGEQFEFERTGRIYPEVHIEKKKEDEEIERKWLVKLRPFIRPEYVQLKIAQGYTVIGEESCARIRCTDTGKTPTDGVPEKRYVQEIKKGKGIKRVEVPIILSEQQFERMWPLTEGARVFKTRIEIPLKTGHTAELDLFEGDLTGFILVEVEFDTEDEANAFIAPEWFGPEVTRYKEYSNLSLALHGWPKTEPIE